MTTEQKYKAIKRRLGITDAQVAAAFGYASAVSFANSSRKPEVIAGIVWLFEAVGEQQRAFFDLPNQEPKQ